MNVSGVVTMLDAASYTSITTPARKSIARSAASAAAAEPLTTPPVLYAAVLAAFTAVISGRLGMVIAAVVYDPAWVDALVDVSAASAADCSTHAVNGASRASAASAATPPNPRAVPSSPG